MISRLKKNGKKGFTLVELIVVIAIIAILAAVAVPTTIHFVEKANKSKEATNIDVRNVVEAIFTNSVTEGIRINTAATPTTGQEDTLKDLFTTQIGNNDSIKYIMIEATVDANDQVTVKYKIVSKKYPNDADKVNIAKTMGGTYPKASLGISATTTAYYTPGTAWTVSADAPTT